MASFCGSKTAWLWAWAGTSQVSIPRPPQEGLEPAPALPTHAPPPRELHLQRHLGIKSQLSLQIPRAEAGKAGPGSRMHGTLRAPLTPGDEL